jgi:hypothetical protein
MSVFTIRGKIIRKADSKPISGLYIEAWDKNSASGELLASSISNQEGVFTIHFDEGVLAELYKDSYPEIYFRIFSGQSLLANTQNSVVVNLRSNQRELVIPIEYKRKEQPVVEARKYTVKGVILKNDFTPASGYTIEVMDKGLVSDLQLAAGKTGANGSYEASFTSEDFKKTGKHSPDIFIKVQGDERNPLTSDVIYNASSVTEIKYVMGGGAFPAESEFERLTTKLEPLLKGAAVKDIKMSDENNPFRLLSEKTGEQEQKLKWYVVAHQLSAENKMPPEFFYAMFRGRLANEPALHLTDIFNRDLNDVTDILKKFKNKEKPDVSFLSLSVEPDKAISSLVKLSDESVPGTLDYAIENNIIPAQIQAKRKEIDKEWAAIKVKYKKKTKADFEKLLSSTRLKPENIKTVSALFEKQSENVPRLFADLEKSKAVSESELNEIKAVDKINRLVNDPSASASIKTSLGIQHPDDVSRLAKYSADDWRKVLSSKSADKKIESIMRTLEHDYPTAAFAGRMEHDSANDFPAKAALLNFLDRRPKVELHKTNFDLLFHTQEKEIRSELKDADNVRTELKKIQRVFKLTPSYEKAKVLLDHNIHSSQSVYNLGEKRFVEKVSGSVISKAEAKKIYKKAEHTYAAALAIMGEIKSLEQGSDLRVLPDVTKTYNNLKYSTIKDFPDWKTLFSSSDICECEHCRSVYSPAAYLTDLLRFLQKRGAKDPLFNRRPDIGEIDLNCDNSLVPIPYIDLVCEILEDTLASSAVNLAGAIEPLLVEGVVHANVRNELKSKNLDLSTDGVVTLGAPGSDEWFIRDKQSTYKISKNAGILSAKVIKQTHDTAAERKAIPEYINYAAYDNHLKTALHPMTLPFDLSWEESRAYLDKIEVSKSLWMEAFRNKATNTPVDHIVAGEYLRLSPKEKDIITTPNVGAQAQFWGGLVDIDKVSAFLHKSQLEYKQLRDLLRLKFINPALDSQIVHGDATCDTEQKTISNLTVAKLDNINRFLRLWKKTKWQMWELDQLIMNPKIGNGLLNNSALVRIKQFDELVKMLNLKTEEVLGYYGDINTLDGKSLYYKLFRSKVILDPLPDAFKVELVTQNPFPNPAPADRTVTAQLSSLAAALKLKEEEALEIQSKSLANDNLTLANISIFFRIASLTRKQKIKVKEFYLLLQILNTGSAFDVFASPQKTKEFLEIIQLLKSVKIGIYDLGYLLLHQDIGPKPLIPAEDKIVIFLTKGRDALQKIKDELEKIIGLPDEVAKLVLGKFADITADEVSTTIQIFNGTFTGNVAARDLFLDTTFTPFIATATLKAALNARDAALPAQKDEKTKEAFEELNKLLIAYLQNDGARQAVIQLYADQFKLSEDISKAFLNELQIAAVDIIEHWFNVGLLAKNNAGQYVNAINPLNFPKLFDSFQLFNKLSLLNTKLPLSFPLVSLVISHSAVFGVLKYDELPVATPVANSNFTKWKEYVLLQQFSALYPDNENGQLAEVMKLLLPMAATENDFLAALALFAGWDEPELVELKQQIGLAYPADYRKPSAFAELDKLVNMLITPAIKASQIPVVLNALPLSTDAIAVKQLVKSKYDNQQWLNTSANIQDSTLESKGIREKKRDALISYFTHHTVNGETFENANALYSYYLLDVEMGSKEVTTRVLQAYLSVQLFVQRCLMNLELAVVADEDADDGWKQWDWMKNYRIWEANRKVFLYPENWIEPELRPDKSYFFKELESDLMQNEVTLPNVENAYLTYLEKLDNVARLNVSGYYYDHETYTLHVFARTYDDPNIYYYRKWVEDRYWTPWEKLDLEINATHVIPVVINRRLYLYWPDFREKSVEPTSTNVPDIKQNSFPIDNPYKYWEIRLCVSELRNKKWTPKKISKTFATSSSSKTLAPKEHFSFIPLDLLDICDKYLIGCFGNSSPTNQSDYNIYALDFFELGGCHGTPELLTDSSVWGLIDQPIVPQFERAELKYLESQEANSSVNNDVLAFQQGNLFINHMPILTKTPGWFRNPVPAQLSFFDKFLVWIYWIYIQILEENDIKWGREWPFPYMTGTLMPYFQEDKKRTFFALQQIILYQYERERDPNTSAPNIKIAELFYTDIVRIIEEFFRTGQIPDLIKPFFEDGKFPSLAYRIKYTNFYHPYVCFMIKQLYKHGLDGMMKREVQLLDKTKYPEIKDFSFKDTYDPTWLVNPGMPTATDQFPYYPKEHIDFDPSGSYSSYNWELFFHAPMMLAVRLSRNQRFEEAQHWFHYIFNPTDTSTHPSPQKFWNTKPFFQRDSQEYIDQRIDQILTMISSGDAELIKQVEDWRRNAFQPHFIAKFRTVAYQKAVVMKYLDNLIDWADNLFRSDRREAINEATQLYILAAEILGPKPMVIPKHVESPVLNFNQLEPKLDAFSNAMINVENFIPFFETDIDEIDISAPLPDLETFYYCIPKNDKLLEYWDKIGDRLFKVRHSMNIDGIERSLALFDPPIDPGLLVKAAASGVSLGAALAGLNAPLPQYRFDRVVQKANEFCNEVKSLGGALLTALEKKDAEAIALLRSTHEIRLQEAVRDLRKKQIEEAKESIETLKKQKIVTEEKKKYYAGLSYMNAAEIIAFTLSSASTACDVAIAAGYILAGGLKAIPQFVIGAAGFGGSPEASGEIGGQQFGDIADAATKTISAIANALDKGAALASTQGSYMRRQEEWDFQKLVATKELDQIDKQISAAEIRLAITEKELENQELAIEQTKESKAFMESKFTNLELYDWMIGQISGVYFQAYQLAFDVAKKAERCYRFELGLADSDFIQFGYWDSLKKGLLSGEKLSLDIHRLETSYIDQNKREFEITKNISLAQVDPLALLQLKQTGECFINLPEELYDLDYPGHYFRRIKSAGISVPCIIGPYNNLNCTLTILKSRTRISPLAANVDYSTPPTENDPGFSFNFSSIQQIVTSTGQNDTGMFDTNLRDDRYLTFEGHGAVSEWKVEINKDFKNFDLETISDVIIHIRYTARQAGKLLATKVKTELTNNFDQIVKTYQNGTGFFKLISMKTDYPTEWHKLLHAPGAPHTVDINFGPGNVPYWLSGKTLEFEGSADGQFMYLKPKTGQVINVNPLNIQFNGQAVDLVPPTKLGEMNIGTSTQSGDLFGTWTINTGANALDASKVDDLLLLVKYVVV